MCVFCSSSAPSLSLFSTTPNDSSKIWDYPTTINIGCLSFTGLYWKFVFECMNLSALKMCHFVFSKSWLDNMKLTGQTQQMEQDKVLPHLTDQRKVEACDSFISMVLNDSEFKFIVKWQACAVTCIHSNYVFFATEMLLSSFLPCKHRHFKMCKFFSGSRSTSLSGVFRRLKCTLEPDRQILPIVYCLQAQIKCL